MVKTFLKGLGSLAAAAKASELRAQFMSGLWVLSRSEDL